MALLNMNITDANLATRSTRSPAPKRLCFRVALRPRKCGLGRPRNHVAETEAEASAFGGGAETAASV